LLACIGLGSSLFAENTRAIELSISASGVSFVPSLTRMDASIPLGQLTGMELLDWTTADCWYLTNSPYYYPGSAIDFGCILELGLGDGPTFPLVLGLGTGFTFVGPDRLSVPAIVSIGGRYVFWDFWRLRPSLSGFIYGEGFISTLSLINDFEFFDSGFLLSVGGDANLAYSVKATLAVNLQVVVGLRYILGKDHE
jgi:hypothetical protein